VEVPIKTIHLRSNGKARISSIHLRTIIGMVPQTASKIIQGGTISILDGVEPQMAGLLG